jgi:hypothetical protein
VVPWALRNHSHGLELEVFGVPATSPFNSQCTIAFGPPTTPPEVAAAVEYANQHALNGDPAAWEDLFEMQRKGLLQCIEDGLTQRCRVGHRDSDFPSDCWPSRFCWLSIPRQPPLPYAGRGSHGVSIRGWPTIGVRYRSERRQGNWLVVRKRVACRLGARSHHREGLLKAVT